MDQKRVLWIVAAVGIFLLVVVGGALILYKPVNNEGRIITEKSASSDIWKNNRTVNNRGEAAQNNSSIPHTVKELTVIAENATIISDSADKNSRQKNFSGKIQFGNPADTDKENFASETDTLNTTNANSSKVSGYPEIAEVPQNENTSQFPQVPKNNGTTQLSIEVKPIKIEGLSSGNSVTVPANAAVTPAANQTVTVINPVNQIQEQQPAKNNLPKVSEKRPEQMPKVEPGKPKVTKTETKKTTDTKAKTKTTANPLPPKYWVQLGSYTVKNNADEVRSTLDEEKIPSEIFTHEDGNKLYYRVRVGPYSTKSEAEYWQKRILTIPQFKSIKPYITNSSGKKQ
jgi:cell division protein FtsN